MKYKTNVCTYSNSDDASRNNMSLILLNWIYYNAPSTKNEWHEMVNGLGSSINKFGRDLREN